MRRSSTLLLIGLFTLLVSLGAQAGNVLSVRVIEASQKASSGGSDAQLSDIEPVLRKQLSYASYTLLDSQETALPADGKLDLKGNLQMECRGSQDNLTLVIRRHNKELLNSTVELQDRKPLILGGFPSPNGKLLIVILAK